MKLLLILLTFFNPDFNRDVVKVEKTYEVENPESMTVIIDNIQGDVTVEATDGKLVIVSLEIQIDADSDASLQKAKKDLQFGEQISSDSLVFYTKAPFIQRKSWSKGWCNNVHIKMETLGYDFKYQYTVKVPKNVMLTAQTINKGDVYVQNVDGAIKASNVNGSVEIKNARKVLHASTVNGDITINFLENLKEAVAFNTVNGDFNFEMPENFSALVYFDSMNGDLYSAFDYQRLGPEVERSNKNGKYRIKTKSGVSIGAGGPQLSFKNINGNVYLKKKK